MYRLKRLARLLVAGALYYSGLLWLIAEFKLRDRAIVLTYHRILPAAADTHSHRAIIVQPETFAVHLRFLRKYFSPLTIAEFRDSLLGARFKRRACLITFDDGWYDNAEHALPLLQEYRIPAIVFIATAYLDSSATFWQESLTRLLHRASRLDVEDDSVLRELGVDPASFSTDESARTAIREVVTQLKTRDRSYTAVLIERLDALLRQHSYADYDLGCDRFLNGAELTRLVDSGLVSIGSHGHSHTPFPRLSYADAKGELLLSRKVLTERTRSEIWACAFPNGEINALTLRAVHDSGYALAFGTEVGHVKTLDNPLRLRRINIDEAGAQTKALFLCRMLGLF